MGVKVSPGSLNGYVWEEENRYIAKAGDTFDAIAAQAYGDGELSPILLYWNPPLAHLLTLEGGELVRIPIIDMAASSLLPPWKEALA